MACPYQMQYRMPTIPAAQIAQSIILSRPLLLSTIWHVLFSSRFPTDNPKQLLVPGVTPYCSQVQYSPSQLALSARGRAMVRGKLRRLPRQREAPPERWEMAFRRFAKGAAWNKKTWDDFLPGNGFMVKPC